MKKLLGILFVLILVIPFAGTYFLLNYQKKIIRKEIKHKIIEGIDKSELVFFSFNENQIKNELRWEHSKEFEYKGEMYDIVEKTTIGNITYMWCWWDHEETKLNKQLKTFISIALGHDKQQRENKKIYNTFLNSLYFTDINNLAIIQPYKFFLFKTTHIQYKSVFITPPNPPPNQV